jgi:RNA polymerase sigma-70 factor (ECF subfamily)
MSTGAARSKPKLWLVGRAPRSVPAAPPSLDDSELLSALRAADPSAAAALHDRVWPQVRRTIRRLLGFDDVDHDDLAQQAMIEVAGAIGRYRGECSLDTWTSTITARVVYRHIRRRRAERRVFGALAPDRLEAARSPSSAGRSLAVRSAMRRVLSHLDTIEQGKAWAFLLHDVGGYDLREIAQIVGVSVEAAQTRLVRGRREIHERIAADPELADALESLEAP